MPDLPMSLRHQPEAFIDYTSHRGVRSIRHIIPTGNVRFLSSEWHPVPQYVLEAWDVEKHDYRSFAMRDIRGFAATREEIIAQQCPVLMPTNQRRFTPEELEAMKAALVDWKTDPIVIEQRVPGKVQVLGAIENVKMDLSGLTPEFMQEAANVIEQEHVLAFVKENCPEALKPVKPESGEA